MSLQELESAVARLSPGELGAFAQWLENFIANEWDKQIEADAAGGKLDHLASLNGSASSGIPPGRTGQWEETGDILRLTRMQTQAAAL